MGGIARPSVLTVAYVSVYLVIVVGLFRVRTPIHLGISLIRDFVPPRFVPWLGTADLIDRSEYELP
jgi:hypothetical protein